MRCEHEVLKKHLFNGGKTLRPCRRRLKLLPWTLTVGRLTWDVYKCKEGHETRLFVKP